MRILPMGPVLGAVLAALIAAGAPHPVRADELASTLPDTDQGAIRQVIQDQIAAFRRDDAGTAFGFASPGIQRMFGNSANFMDMVRRGYAPVYRPRGVAFGDLVEIDGRTVQKVRLVGPDGSAARALYTMERQADGSWRIDGCTLQPDEAVGA